MAVRFFPATSGGVCAICSGDYQRLSMVGFFPPGSISHMPCVLSPPKMVPDAPLDIAPIKKLIKNKIAPGCTPRDFQLEAVAFLNQRKGRAGIFDDMGLGKTISVLLWLAANPKKRPVVIVCPSSVKLNWRREILKWLPVYSRAIAVLSGRKATPISAGTQYVIINPDILKHWLAELRVFKPSVVVADECHYFKNPKAQRTIAIYGNRKAEEWLIKGVRSFIPLSGTPMTNRPIELWPTLNALSPIEWPSWYAFAKQYANLKRTQWGMQATGAQNIAELHRRIRRFMIRREKSQVLKELPAKQRSIIPVELSNIEEYRKAEKDFIRWLIENGADRNKLDRAKKALALVKMNALKKLCAVGKIALTIEWIKDFLEGSEEKLVVFGHHRSVIEGIAIANYSYGALSITGKHTPIQRQKAVDTFQGSNGCRLVVCSRKAAGEGITLHAASSTCFIELGWTPGEHDQAEDRIHRIGQKKACTNYYLVAADTIEETIAALIDGKRRVLKGVLDNKALDDGEAIFDALIAELAKKGKAA